MNIALHSRGRLLLGTYLSGNLGNMKVQGQSSFFATSKKLGQQVRRRAMSYAHGYFFLLGVADGSRTSPVLHQAFVRASVIFVLGRRRRPPAKAYREILCMGTLDRSGFLFQHVYADRRLCAISDHSWLSRLFSSDIRQTENPRARSKL